MKDSPLGVNSKKVTMLRFGVLGVLAIIFLPIAAYSQVAPKEVFSQASDTAISLGEPPHAHFSIEVGLGVASRSLREEPLSLLRYHGTAFSPSLRIRRNNDTRVEQEFELSFVAGSYESEFGRLIEEQRGWVGIQHYFPITEPQDEISVSLLGGLFMGGASRNNTVVRTGEVWASFQSGARVWIEKASYEIAAKLAFTLFAIDLRSGFGGAPPEGAEAAETFWQSLSAAKFKSGLSLQQIRAEVEYRYFISKKIHLGARVGMMYQHSTTPETQSFLLISIEPTLQIVL